MMQNQSELSTQCLDPTVLLLQQQQWREKADESLLHIKALKARTVATNKINNHLIETPFLLI